MVLYHSSPSKIITPTFALGEGRHCYGKAQGCRPAEDEGCGGQVACVLCGCRDKGD